MCLSSDIWYFFPPIWLLIISAIRLKRTSLAFLTHLITGSCSKVASIDLTFSDDSPGAGTKHFREKTMVWFISKRTAFQTWPVSWNNPQKIRRLASEVMEAEWIHALLWVSRKCSSLCRSLPNNDPSHRIPSHKHDRCWVCALPPC